MTAYARDVAVLARKDLLLELRTRETVPAMLLFVVGALVVFHFALPDSAGDDAARGLLWIGIIVAVLSFPLFLVLSRLGLNTSDH